MLKCLKTLNASAIKKGQKVTGSLLDGNRSHVHQGLKFWILGRWIKRSRMATLLPVLPLGRRQWLGQSHYRGLEKQKSMGCFYFPKVNVFAAQLPICRGENPSEGNVPGIPQMFRPSSLTMSDWLWPLSRHSCKRLILYLLITFQTCLLHYVT